MNEITSNNSIEQVSINQDGKDFSSIFDYYDYYKKQFPTLSDHARKLNYFMKDEVYSAEQIGKILYVRLMNDHADISINRIKVMGKGTQKEIDNRLGFSNLIQKIQGMPIGGSETIYFGFTYNTKEYYISRISKDKWTVIGTNDVYKNARKEGGGTAPDPREDSLDYGARGGNSAAPTQFH